MILFFGFPVGLHGQLTYLRDIYRTTFGNYVFKRHMYATPGQGESRSTIVFGMKFCIIRILIDTTYTGRWLGDRKSAWKLGLAPTSPQPWSYHRWHIGLVSLDSSYVLAKAESCTWRIHYWISIQQSMRLRSYRISLCAKYMILDLSHIHQMLNENVVPGH